MIRCKETGPQDHVLVHQEPDQLPTADGWGTPSHGGGPPSSVFPYYYPEPMKFHYTDPVTANQEEPLSIHNAPLLRARKMAL
jgi:hypothetical protein